MRASEGARHGLMPEAAVRMACKDTTDCLVPAKIQRVVWCLWKVECWPQVVNMGACLSELAPGLFGDGSMELKRAGRLRCLWVHHMHAHEAGQA
eukprot:1063066-Pelagomonas_calceolata.AAC.14